MGKEKSRHFSNVILKPLEQRDKLLNRRASYLDKRRHVNVGLLIYKLVVE